MTMAAFNTTPSSNDSTTQLPDFTTSDNTTSTNTTQFPYDFGCIPAEVAFVVMASVGSLVVFLLASILVLACQVCRLQRRRSSGRQTRSNVDLVSGTGYWGAGTQAEGGGIVGPCDASVMLEEVKAQDEQPKKEAVSSFDEFESEEGSEVLVTPESRAQSGITVAPVGELVEIGDTNPIPPPPPPPPMPGSTSQESCLEAVKDLEDMPLVV